MFSCSCLSWNSDVFILTYGAIVSSVLKNCENVQTANEKLEKIGFNIGTRLIDDFLVKSAFQCRTFRETIDGVKVAFKMYLGINIEVRHSSSIDGKSDEISEYSIELKENPLNEYVELPHELTSLRYLAILCGVIKGALAQIGIRTEVRETSTVLRRESSCDVLKVTFLGSD
ncbi:hypothetical protein RCL1_004843 [Eukaryota sp. TZLM3-RCL]